jgi:hypothetical protein
MSESADTTATRVHDALTDLAASMPDHVLPFERVEKAVRRLHRRRRVARTGTAVVMVAAAAVGGLILLRAPTPEGGVPPLSAPSASALPSCRAVAAAAAATPPVKAAAPPTDATAAAEDPAARLAAERAKAAAVAAATGAPGSAASSPSTDHIKGIGVIVGTPTADSLTVAVHDGGAAGVTLSLTLSAATQYLADGRACTPEPLSTGQEVGFVATYGPDGTLAVDDVLFP